MIIAFDNTYGQLPGVCHSRAMPTPVARPELIAWNADLADELGIDLSATDADSMAQVLAGNQLPEGADPLAMAYAGHQFGHFVPQLGDGRAILLGEVLDRKGQRRDIQLKGAGPTPYSRGGDGRAALGPVLREYLLSEAMAALGVPTTRALAAVGSGEFVQREQALPGAILTRVASSHLRVGTFQYLAARGDKPALEALIRYALDRHQPDAPDDEQGLLSLFSGVVERQARLVAAWMQIGFIHGVMNTDNTAISGETIDYGPCAFLDEYHSAAVFSAIDRGGRYAFSRQPMIAQWNLARLAEALLSLSADTQVRLHQPFIDQLEAFPDQFRSYWLEGMREKFGLHSSQPEDPELIQDFLDLLEQQSVDFTLAFRYLGRALPDDQPDELMRLLPDPLLLAPWLARWHERLELENIAAADRRRQMQAKNPAFIPRNHQLARIIDAAIGEQDFAPFHELLEVCTRPFDEQPEKAALQQPPKPDERVLQTFCGT